ncbi:MAG: hypothetical protein FD130_2038, partial [Halothiobacillaceae bacterium]
MPNKEYDVLVNRRIIDNVSVALLLFDHQLRLIFINPAGEMLL